MPVEARGRLIVSHPGLARYLALGDSYTIGEGVDPQDAWPAQLVRALNARGIPMAAPEIIAATGWTTADLMREIAVAKPVGPYSLVTVLSGVNNQYRGISVPVYRGQFRRLLRHAVALADSGDCVIVVSIPDWGVTPFNTRRSRPRVAQVIDSFNRANQREAATAGTRWVDVTDLSREDPLAVTSDGLHPNAAMYTRWVGRIAPVATQALRESSAASNWRVIRGARA
jgi:lysophospholipase L1-like esterase